MARVSEKAMPKTSLTIHKFGGTSLQTADHYRHISDLLEGGHEAVVVSASAKTTDALQHVLATASAKQDFSTDLQTLQTFQQELVESLLTDGKSTVLASLKKDFHAIHDILHAIKLVGDYSASMRDSVLGFGELWSAKLLCAHLNGACMIDARQVLFVENKDGMINVDWEKSHQALQALLQDKKHQTLIITGYIASTIDNHPTTLGKNGSDFSAAIFANLLDADKLIKWTDVDGVFSADPRRVPSAFAIEALSYKEALELAYFGANIIHPQAVYPAVEKKIPIYIKNAEKPELPGTKISADKTQSEFLIQGVTSIDHIALINIEGTGMIGVSGFSARVFQVLYHAGISVILISQASSEHSICFAVKAEQADLAIKVLKEQFAYEISQHKIEGIFADKDCAILATVGDNMVGAIGVSGKLCSTLAKASVNIRAISQGSSERNISVVVNKNDIDRALRAVHGGFYLSNKTVSIGLIGPGGVGTDLLDQLAETVADLETKYSVNLRVRAIANSTKMLLQNRAISLPTWQQAFADNAVALDMDKFINHVAADDIPHAAIIDCTASQEVTNYYPQFIDCGMHIVTPNKRANSGDINFYHDLKQRAVKKGRHYLYETTVCAGLPIIKTLQDLIQTGDEVISIEGVVSGTLGYIFDELSKGKTFSEAVQSGFDKGYTEPDPRDDLSGTDVARKFTCLARELGFNALLDDVSVANLVPVPLQDVSKEDFMSKLSGFDQDMQNKMQALIEGDEKLCYVGKVDQAGKITVDMQAYPPGHPFYNLKGTDNMLIFKTRRYDEFPLVIQGPGAGTEVTAAGVFADLLRLVSFL